MVERTLADVSEIKNILSKLTEIEGFEELEQEFLSCYKTNTSLINTMKCDNPKISQIVSELFN